MSFAGETASSVIRTMEFLFAKHCRNLEAAPAPTRAERKLVAAIPKVAPRIPMARVSVTPELHDMIYAEATTTRRSVPDIAAAHRVSESTVFKIKSRRHPFYEPLRTEEFRFNHLKAQLGR